MTAIKRTLASLVLTGGAALALTPVAAHADATADQAPPVAGRVLEIVDHPAQTVEDTRTAIGVTAGAVGAASQATDTSLAGAGSALGSGLPKTPKAG
ncbi:hypothetical protein [Streptomyces sp. NPDC047014]|uniref:hypothetical protein n=1 Tax=Streptomyces sp. NPDC047014 TaxID=3155736 RepID=UPI0033C47A31